MMKSNYISQNHMETLSLFQKSAINDTKNLTKISICEIWL